MIDGWAASIFLDRSILFLAMGLVIGALRVISGSLWTGIGFHVAFQVAMQLFLSSNYVDITVSDEGIFTLVSAALAFIAATTVAGLFWRGKTNWATLEPDIPNRAVPS